MTVGDRVHPNTSLHVLVHNLRPAMHRVRGALVATAVIAAAALAIVVGTGQPASAGPQPVMTGYVPLPADDFQAYLEAISTGADTTLDFTVGITNAATGSIMYYDHAEDGFEGDLANPAQSSTLVFGDNDTGNGDASDHCDVCTGDLLPQGAALIMRNDVSTPRGSTVLFDGGDKVASTRGFAITAGGFSIPVGSVLSGVVSAYDTSKYGTRFTVPVGEDTPIPGGATDPFEYVGASIMAAQDGTVVEVDRDGDGTPEVVETIDEGEATFAAGLLQEGASIRSSLPVQVHMLTGNRASSYEARSYTLFPDDVLSSDYMSPAGSGLSTARTVNYLYNPSDTNLTVTPTCTGCSGTITVPANASASFVSPLNRAVRFESSGARPFIAIAAIGAQDTASQAAMFDWGYPMIPTSQLTTQVVLGWAPGNSSNPPGTTGTQYRYDPVWVTSLGATTVRVDYDGDPSTGTITTDDCFGSNHDAEISVAALASTRIFDQADGDMTGARIYTCDGTQLAGAWGQDPVNSVFGSPGFDAGYTIIPTTTMLVEKSAALVDDVDGDGGFGPGDTMTYEIAIADAGSLAFTDVHLEDVLPPGLEYVPGSTSIEVDGNVTPIADDMVPPASTVFPLDDNVGLPDIDAGATVYVRFDAAIAEPWSLDSNVLDNTACVVANEAQACDTSQTQLTIADVSLTKTETADPTYLGEEAVFQIRVDNAGPDDAPGVEVTDLLPAGLTFVSADPSQGAYDDTTGIWSVGTVPVDDFATLELVATVEDANPITNVAEVSGGGYVDPDSEPVENPLGPGTTNPPDQDDEGSASVDVDLAADLSLTKTVTGTPPTHVGDPTTFEVTVTNDGLSDATGVQVGDLLPAGLTFVSSNPEVGTYDDTSGVWNVGGLDAGDAVTLEITATVDAEGALNNTAQVIAADQHDPDSTPDNDVPTEDDQASAGVSVAALADLSLSKTETANPTHVGDAAVFEIVVTNGGPSDATGVQVGDLLPAGLTFVSSAPEVGSYDETTGIWTVGDLDAGDAVTLEITATVDTDGTIDNTAQVVAADQDDPDSTPDNDEPTEDDQASAAVRTDPIVDLSLTKTETANPTHVGDDATFEVVVTNGGPSDATGVEVTDLLPAGLTYEGATASQGTYDDATGVWTVGDLDAGDSATLTIDTTVDVLSAVNVAEVTDVNEDDADSQPAEDPLGANDPPNQDDEGTAAVAVDASADLSLTKAVSGPTPTHVGDTATFEIVLSNDGPSDATGVQVGDLLPAGLTFVSSNPEVGTYDDTSGAWNVGDLDAGDSVTLEITATVDAEGALNNTAQVIAADQDDPDSTPDNDVPGEDDQASAAVSVGPLVDLSLTKAQTGTPTHLGDAATYVITVHNGGPSDATGVEVTDLLPSGVAYDSSSSSQGAYDDATGVWTVGDLDADGSATLTIEATVNVLSAVNVAEVTDVVQDDADSQPAEDPLGANDPPNQDDEGSVLVTLQALADLSLTKTETASPTHVGDEATFEIVVTNDGPSPATDVEVTDLLPSGLTYVSDDGAGDYDELTGIWTVGDLAVDGTATLHITATVDTTQVTNSAEVTDATEDDPDSTPDNDDPQEDDQDSVKVTVDPLVDLSLSKALTTTPAYLGETGVFTITVNNAGPSDATGVQVTDELPAGLTYLSDDSAGDYDEATGLWDVGTIAAGGSRSLAITVQVDQLSATNYAQVSDQNEDDVDSEPNTDELSGQNPPDQDDEGSAPVEVDPIADLSLTKTSSPSSVNQGDDATFTISVTNDGPSQATGVQVTDVLPAGVTYTASDASQGSYDDATGIWNVGTLDVDETATLEIDVTVDAAGPIPNTAQVADVDQHDPDSTPGNDDPSEDDQDSTTLTSDPVIDLSVTKGVSAGSAHVGDDVTFSVGVANGGPSDATGVQVTDLLPAGVTYVDHDASQGSYDPGTGLWNVGSVADGDDASLTITVTVDDSGAIDNFAQVTSAADQLDTDSQPGEDVLGPTNGPNQDDEATASVTGVQIDLELDVATSASQFDVGDEVTFTVTLTNQCPSAATGVSVADLLPPGLTFVSASTATGSYASGVWTVGDLGVGETVTVQVVARVAAAGPLSYGGQVETAIEPDVDSTPSNDAPGEDDQDVVTITGVEADLSLTKTVDDTTPGLGDRVTYTLTVTNDGPADATNVVVSDELPNGLEWVSDTSGGDYDPATGEWNVGSLANGASESIRITVRTTSAGPIANRASVIEVDQPDPDSTPDNDDPTEDDEDTVTVTPEPASVSGLVWLDRDGDGRFDEGESPIEGVKVLLFDDEGNLVASTETDAEGRYEFTDLPVGTYLITIDEDSLPDTIDGQTYDPDDVVDGSHEVTLVAGEQVVDVDFGFEPVASPIDQLEEELTQLVDDVLARTGIDAWWQLRAALALLTLGGGLILLARRRRPDAS